MKRRLAREIVVQCLYQMEMNEVTGEEALQVILDEAAGENEVEIDLTDVQQVMSFLKKELTGVWQNKTMIDDILVHYLKGWQVERLSKVDRQILRIAVFEMIFLQDEDVPARVSINEAIECSKHFGTVESGKFVNGVLGKLILEVEQIKQRVGGN